MSLRKAMKTLDKERPISRGLMEAIQEERSKPLGQFDEMRYVALLAEYAHAEISYNEGYVGQISLQAWLDDKHQRKAPPVNPDWDPKRQLEEVLNRVRSHEPGVEHLWKPPAK
jgi:hypothetical protein